MNHYIKLVNFEVKRFSKLFLTLIIAVIATQITGAIVTSSLYVSNAETTMVRDQMTVSNYIQTYGAYSLQNFLFSEYFFLSVIFAAALLMIYVFFIWYRDWLRKVIGYLSFAHAAYSTQKCVFRQIDNNIAFYFRFNSNANHLTGSCESNYSTNST